MPRWPRPAALALITTTFPAGPARNRAFAVYAAMSGAGAAVGLILGGWLTGLRLRHVRPRRPRLAADVPDQRADRHRRRAARAALPARVREPPRPARRPRRHHRHRRPARARLRPHPRRQPDVRLERPLDDHQPGRRRACCWRCSSRSSRRVEHPLLPFRIFANRTRAASFVAMMLLPAAMFAMFFFLSLFIQNVMGYSPLKTGVAFLPFSVGIVISAGIVSNLVNRIDAALHRRRRHADRRRPRCSGSPGSSVPDSDSSVVQAVLQRAVPRRRRQLLDPDPAVRGADGARHGRGLRAADPDRRPPRAGRGLRHRLGRAQHHAAGRRRPRPGDPGHGGQPLHRPPTSRRSRPASAAGLQQADPGVARAADGAASASAPSRSWSARSSYLGALHRGRDGRRSWSACS